MKKRGVVSITGIPTRVLEATAEEIDDVNLLADTDYSSYDADTSTIYIAASIQEPDMKGFYAVHEALHAGWQHSGLGPSLQKKLRLTVEEINDLEEQVVTALTPSVHSAHADLTKLFARFRRAR